MSEVNANKRQRETEESSTTAVKTKKWKRKELQNEYEVEKIRGHRYSEERKRTEYFIKWKDYPETDNTWEGEDNLVGCRQLLDEYHSSTDKKEFKSPDTTVPDLTSIMNGGLVVEDDIDRQLVKDLGAELARNSWEVRKLGTGRYEIIHRGRTAASPAPSTSSSTEVENKALSAAGSKKVLKRLQKWISEVNKICERIGEAQLFIENFVDGAIITTKDFTYVTTLVAGNGVDIPTENVIGCSCKTKDGSCLGKRCCASGMGAEFAFAPNGLLRLESGRPIYECNSKCSCNENCSNRVVQKGRKIELCIFRTNDGRGWGVKAKTDIPKHRFVTEYVGEVITKDEADARQNDSYMFNMDFDENPQYVVDARRLGNVSRFINHSCDPNLGVFGVWIDHYIGKLPRLAFFALRDIKAGEELSFNYFSGNRPRNDAADNSIRSDDSDDETIAAAVAATLKAKKSTKNKCKCGSAICRKYPFENGRS